MSTTKVDRQVAISIGQPYPYTEEQRQLVKSDIADVFISDKLATIFPNSSAFMEDPGRGGWTAITINAKAPEVRREDRISTAINNVFNFPPYSIYVNDERGDDGFNEQKVMLYRHANWRTKGLAYDIEAANYLRESINSRSIDIAREMLGSRNSLLRELGVSSLGEAYQVAGVSGLMEVVEEILKEDLLENSPNQMETALSEVEDLLRSEFGITKMLYRVIGADRPGVLFDPESNGELRVLVHTGVVDGSVYRRLGVSSALLLSLLLARDGRIDEVCNQATSAAFAQVVKGINKITVQRTLQCIQYSMKLGADIDRIVAEISDEELQIKAIAELVRSKDTPLEAINPYGVFTPFKYFKEFEMLQLSRGTRSVSEFAQRVLESVSGKYQAPEGPTQN